jgi:hypothetical protein
MGLSGAFLKKKYIRPPELRQKLIRDLPAAIDSKTHTRDRAGRIRGKYLGGILIPPIA